MQSPSLFHKTGGQANPPLTLDFWVADDGADLLQSLGACVLHLGVGVGEHLRQLGHDVGQAGRQLLGGTERHGAQQLHRACIQVTNCKRIYPIRLLCFDSFGSVTVSLVTVSHTRHSSRNPFRSALVVFSRPRLISPAPSGL